MYVYAATAWAYCGCCVQEDKKILFYYPTDVELDTKIRQIGLCEAVVKFTRYVLSVLVVQKLLPFAISHCILCNLCFILHC